uniref:Uncharacterized protein n=1 Tax=Tanacetum cinerariifolium TaxID=118510 RepID=A0A699GMF8_TANCI|nr:hypothetical protein [Tanacetum cinerariifolium]
MKGPEKPKKKPNKAAKGNQGKGKANMGYAHVPAPHFAPKPRNLQHSRRIILRRTRSATNVGLRRSRKLKPEALRLYVGDGHRVTVEAIREFHLSENPSGETLAKNSSKKPSGETPSEKPSCETPSEKQSSETTSEKPSNYTLTVVGALTEDMESQKDSNLTMVAVELKVWVDDKVVRYHCTTRGFEGNSEQVMDRLNLKKTEVPRDWNKVLEKDFKKLEFLRLIVSFCKAHVFGKFPANSAELKYLRSVLPELYPEYIHQEDGVSPDGFSDGVSPDGFSDGVSEDGFLARVSPDGLSARVSPDEFSDGVSPDGL